MFTSVTWSQFLFCAALVLAVYYLVVLLTCYRKPLCQKLATALRRKSPIASNEVAGPAAPGDIACTSLSGLQVAPPAAGPAHGPSAGIPSQGGALGELAALLQESEILVAHAAATASSKEDFLSLLRLLAANSPALAHSPYRQPALQFLRAQCQGRLSFDLLPEDLQQVWVQPSN